uniref:Peptidase A2 domain-containing protein n=1 Tax=Romanomermis culicivorax TaxID=13658 RepID=A0A915K9C8_ROMCU
MPPMHDKLTLESIRTIFMADMIGDPTAEHRPKEAQTTPAAREIIFMKNTYAIYPNHQFLAPWEQHIHYNAMPAPYVTTPTDSSRNSSQSSELQLALPVLPPPTAVSTPALETHVINHSTSAANMVIPSKEIASAALIVSPCIVCWNATGRAFQDPCHIRSSVCQIDNLTLSSKTFVGKYVSTRAFQIPIKLGAIKAHALIDTGAQCSILSSGL